LLVRRAAIRVRTARGVAPALSRERSSPQREQAPIDRVRLDVLWDASAGLGLVDPLRAMYLHSVGLDLALAHGDASRLSRALIGDVPYRAAAGRPSRGLDGLVALTDRAAGVSGFPALSPLVRGVIGFLSGRWAQCQRELEAAERMLARDSAQLVEEGVGAVQLLDATRNFQLTAMFYLGRLHELGRRLPELLQDALERSDLASATYLRCGLSSMVQLAVGDVDTAIRNNDDGFAPWRTRRGGIPHFMYVQGGAAIDIYLGRGADAHRRIVAAWRELAQARLVRVQYVHISLLDTRGRAAMAAAASSAGRDRAGLLVDARRCARQLRAVRASWSIPLGDAIDAGAAILDNDRSTALAHLARCTAGFTSADMALHAATARLVHAELAGDTTSAGRERDVARNLGVRDVERFSSLLLPR
jgi:hypothetical protein